MLKYIVIAIPEVRLAITANDLFDKAYKHLLSLQPSATYVVEDKFPEKVSGAEEIRQDVRTYVKIGHCAVIMTKFTFALEQLCNDVANGVLARDEVLFKLARYDEHQQLVVTDHYMTEDGYLGDNWPLGVLW